MKGISSVGDNQNLSNTFDLCSDLGAGTQVHETQVAIGVEM